MSAIFHSIDSSTYSHQLLYFILRFSYFILPTQVLQTLNSSTLLLTFLYIIFPLQVLQSLHSSASFPFTFRSFLFVFLFFRTHICILFAPLKSPLFPTDTDNCHFSVSLVITFLFPFAYITNYQHIIKSKILISCTLCQYGTFSGSTFPFIHL